MLRKCKVKIEWSPAFAYAIGLIATDGNLSPNGRIINMTSKDLDMVEAFRKCLKIDNRITSKARGGETEKKYYVVQLGDVNFFEFLNSIGLHPKKSKTITSVNVPTKYFRDFLRGCLDGDGNISTFAHPESKQQQLRVRFVSASKEFLEWTHLKINNLADISGGWISPTKSNGVFTLSFGKADAIKLFQFMYYDGVYPYLRRKYDLAQKWAGGETG